MKVVIVHGAPLAGKSTYVRDHIGPDDLLFDFDTIMAAITGKQTHQRNDNLIEYVIDIRSLIISKLKSETKINTAWIIVTKPDQKLKESLTGLNPEYKLISVTIEEAKQRLNNKPGDRNKAQWSQAIDRYFIGTADHSRFYKSYAWKRKREVILKRDTYLCQNCRRYGTNTPANTIHHILPIEVRPDLKLANDNLTSLCQPCHERMHDKWRDGLSELGEETRKRTLRQHPELAAGPTE